MRPSLQLLVCIACTAAVGCHASSFEPDAAVADGASGGTGAGATAGEGGAGAGGMTAGTNSSGGTSSGGMSGGGTNGGNAGNGDAPLSCMERVEIAGDAIREALDAVGLACDTTEDCQEISIDTDCHASCGALTTVEGSASIASVIAEQNATTCARYEDDGCDRSIPPCVSPGDYACIGHQCVFHDGPSTLDCADQAITWGPNGGFVAWIETYTLTPCNTFSVMRDNFGDALPLTCENDIDLGREVSPDAVDDAILHPDVQAAITQASMSDTPLLFGTDARPVDGQVLRIEIGAAVIEVGYACTVAPCPNPIPEGIEALRVLLTALTEQQRALPDCDELP